jgi:hypothetical protein
MHQADTQISTPNSRNSTTHLKKTTNGSDIGNNSTWGSKKLTIASQSGTYRLRSEIDEQTYANMYSVITRANQPNILEKMDENLKIKI